MPHEHDVESHLSADPIELVPFDSADSSPSNSPPQSSDRREAESARREAESAPIRAEVAFRAALPTLLETDLDQWVAFTEEGIVRRGNSQTELYRHCLNDLGLTHDRFVIRRVIPDSGSTIEYPPR